MVLCLDRLFMDYSEVCQGWIYCITNKINGKKYIGQTTDFETRKRHHFLRNSTCSYLKRAMNKYGKENFEMLPILTFNAINKEICTDVLKKLEVLYIKKFDTFNPKKGYNLTAGGEGNSYIRTEEVKRKISESLKGRHPSEETLEKYRQNSHVENLGDCRKPVLLYHLDGTFYKGFNSVSDAIISLGGKPRNGQVSKALKSGKHQAFGYLWRYDTTKHFPLFIDAYANPFIKPVYHYTVEGQLIKRYSSVGEASEELGLKANSIARNALYSKGKIHKKDYWSYDGPAC